MDVVSKRCWREIFGDRELLCRLLSLSVLSAFLNGCTSYVDLQFRNGDAGAWNELFGSLAIGFL